MIYSFSILPKQALIFIYRFHHFRHVGIYAAGGDELADAVGGHVVVGVGCAANMVDGIPVEAGLQPQGFLSGAEDDGHAQLAVVDTRHKGVGCGGEDAVGEVHFACAGIGPLLPDACHAEEGAATEVDEVGQFFFFDLLPLVKPGAGHEAAPPGYGSLEGGLVPHVLATAVVGHGLHLAGGIRVAAPVGYEAPGEGLYQCGAVAGDDGPCGVAESAGMVDGLWLIGMRQGCPVTLCQFPGLFGLAVMETHPHRLIFQLEIYRENIFYAHQFPMLPAGDPVGHNRYYP